MKLTSQRLNILALSGDEVGLLAADLASLQAKLGLVYKGEAIIGHLLEVTKQQAKAIAADNKNVLWNTFWLFVLKEENTAIGSACFKGAPDASGAVEIGYGTNELFQNKGYTSEAVGALCRWAFTQPDVKTVLAETDKSNLASHRVLEKNGFVVSRQTADCLWWQVSALGIT